MSSGTRHTHTHIGTGWLERKGEEDGGTGEEVSEGGWEVCARNRRQAGQPIPLDCIFFSACRGRVILYGCVCVCVPGWVGVRYNPSALCGASSLSTAASLTLQLLFEICSRIVVVVVGLVYFMCVCVCLYINWQCGWVVVVAELNLDFVLLALRFAIFVRVSLWSNLSLASVCSLPLLCSIFIIYTLFGTHNLLIN